MAFKNIDALTLKQWLDDNEAILIDVREPAEHKTANIPGSVLKPLGSLCYGDLPESGKKIVLHCQKGSRGLRACEKLCLESSKIEIFNLEGGVEAWQQAGFFVESKGEKTLPLDRQVQLTIGLCVLIFGLLGSFVNPLFALGAAFFGAGLVNAGLTGWCGLAQLMAKMPWNT